LVGQAIFMTRREGSSENSNTGSQDKGRAWMLFVFALPAVTVLAGVITVFIAFKYADEEVGGEINRFGVSVHKDQVEPSNKR
jgi:hypothetical protein